MRRGHGRTETSPPAPTASCSRTLGKVIGPILITYGGKDPPPPDDPTAATSPAERLDHRRPRSAGTPGLKYRVYMLAGSRGTRP